MIAWYSWRWAWNMHIIMDLFMVPLDCIMSRSPKMAIRRFIKSTILLPGAAWNCRWQTKPISGLLFVEERRSQMLKRWKSLCSKIFILLEFVYSNWWLAASTPRNFPSHSTLCHWHGLNMQNRHLWSRSSSNAFSLIQSLKERENLQTSEVYWLQSTPSFLRRAIIRWESHISARKATFWTR